MERIKWKTLGLGLLVGAIAFLPGVRIPIAGEDPLFYAYEVLVFIAAVAALRDYYFAKLAEPVRWTTAGTAMLAVVFVTASVFGEQPLLSIGIARVTVEAAVLAWSVPALVRRLGLRFFVWVALGGVAVHSALLLIALGQHTEGTYDVTLRIRNEVRLLGGSLNNAGAQFLMLLPLALVGGAFVDRRARLVVFLGVLLSTWGLVISESRALAGGLAVIAAGFIVGALLSGLELRRKVQVLGVALFSGLILGLFMHPIVAAANDATDYVASIVQGEGHGSGGPSNPEPPQEEDIDERNSSSDLRRTAAWQLAIEEFVSHPVLGTGFRRRSLEGAREFFAHNVLFENLAGTGAAGTLSFIALVGIYLWHGFRGRWRYWKIVLAAGVLAGVLVAMVQPFLNTSHQYAGQWWLLLALAGQTLPRSVADEFTGHDEKVGSSAQGQAHTQ